ncbi:hypothetical protein E2986_03715 [Frieseomelitta varia]|uniref:Uncharacterized protein n=1 Tax=Frieseomelitta varia TaxID=561572 RepID=A0A833S6U0_9HYME|nr:hypothetical protein E2986_03715 [Frieseomelitta varia]
MSCLTALDSQIVTLFSVPHEILLLQHKVFREYAKIAVGPDFIHTLPSFFILTSMAIVLWRNPPSCNGLAQTVASTAVYKAFQVTSRRVVYRGNVSPRVTLDLFLIEAAGQLGRRRCGFVVLANGAEAALLLRLDVLENSLLCSQESEYRVVSHQWWQQVWSSYYPPPLQPPVMSADFISWLISMSIATTCLGCAVSTNQVWNIVVDSTTGARDMLVTTKCYADAWFKRMITTVLQLYWPPEEPPPIAKKTNVVGINDSEGSSICDECRSEISSDATNEPRREILPISYGTNWLPKPDFTGYKDAQRKVSMKSLHTVAVVNDIQDNSDDLSPRQLRYKRGCHTVIPNNSSDQSSGC